MTQTLGWTRADQAELEVLIWHLVEAAEVHRELCRACYTLNRWCPPLADAWLAVEDWRNRRRLLSKAQYLRAATRPPISVCLDMEGLEVHTGSRLVNP